MKKLALSLLMVISILISCVSVAGCGGKDVSSKSNTASQPLKQESSSSAEAVSSEVSSLESGSSEISSLQSSSKPQPTSSKKPTATSSKNNTAAKPAPTPTYTGGYNPNTNLNIEDNVFMDSLIYTGYNMKKHRADGNMWKYILAGTKRGLGYLSKISFGGGSSGYETTKDGKPDIKAFQRGGLVCASFATYVYFNYLPNVAGIDTSSLTRPDRSYNANSWYNAAKDWVKKGYSRYVSFTAKNTPSAIQFSLKEDIPIGSVIFFRNLDEPGSKSASHVVIYGGKKNGYHWVYHTGNKNGPEMCAVERMKFGPDPQWPIAVITAPKNIRMAAGITVELKDDKDKAISGVEFTLKNSATGKTVTLGKTNSKGVVSKEGLSYGKYTLTQVKLPAGYTADSLSKQITLNTKDNSSNKIKVLNKLIPPVEENPVSSNTSADSSNTSSSNNSSGTSSGTTSPASSSTPQPASFKKHDELLESKETE